MASLKVLLGWRNLRAGTATTAALLVLLLSTNTLRAQDTEVRPPRARDTLRRASEAYSRGDYDGAALLFSMVQTNQAELLPQEQKDLQELVSKNTVARQGRQEGVDKLRRASELVSQGKMQEATPLLQSLQAHQYLSSQDKLVVAKLNERVRTAPPGSAITAQAQVTVATKEDMKTLLTQARSALQHNDLDTAEFVAKQAQKANNGIIPQWMRPWDDNPEKVLHDVQAARAKQAPPVAPVAKVGEKQETGSPLMTPINAVKNLFVRPQAAPEQTQPVKVDDGKPQVAARTNSSPVTPTGPDLAPNTASTVAGPASNTQVPPKNAPKGVQPVSVETLQARVYLQQAKTALAANDLNKAQSLVLQAKALKARLEWWDDQPDKMLADIARRAGVPGAPKLDAVASRNAAQQTPDPRMVPPTQEKQDPRLLLRQGREKFHENKLEEAEKLCARAASQPATWGLFEDSPEKLRQEIQRARGRNDREESVKLMVEARKEFQKGDLASAKTKAFRARQLHGQYALWDLGDRPDNLLREIDVAEVAQRKQGGPALVKDDKNKTNLAQNKVEPTPAQPTTVALQARTTARTLLAEAAVLEKQNMLVEAAQKANEGQKWALEAQKGGAYFATGEDTPGQALQRLGLVCKHRVNGLVQGAEEVALRSADPARFQKAAESLAQARALAVAFRHDVVPIDQKADWLRSVQTGAPTRPDMPLVQNPVLPGDPKLPPPVGIVQTPPVLPPVNVAQAKADPHKQGLELLEKARLELRSGSTKQARQIAEEAFAKQYDVQAQAADVLRSIDMEELAQKQLAMNRNFDAGLDAFVRRDYKQALVAFQNLDERMLSPDKLGRLREIMGTREMQPELLNAGKALVQVGSQNPGVPGNVSISDMNGGERMLVGSSVGKGPNGQLAEHKVMEDIRYKKLTADGLEAQRRAMTAAKAKDHVAALDILSTYDASLQQADLSGDHATILRRPIERLMAQYKTLKAQDELDGAVKKNGGLNATNSEKVRIAEKQEKDSKIADLMKQFNKLYREGQYKQAEVLITRGKDIDRDNYAVDAAIIMAKQAWAKDEDEKVRKGWGEVYDDNGRSDAPGPLVNMQNPLSFDPIRSGIAGKRANLGNGIASMNHNVREREIERRLLNPVSLNYKDTPLKDVINSLGTMTGTNIVPDVEALESADIVMTRPMSLKVENISLKSALNLLLKQAKLTYVIQNEVLTVTTEEHAKGKLKVVTYHVADLVVPVENHSLPVVADFNRRMADHVGGQNYSNAGPVPYQGPNSIRSGDVVSSPGTMGSQAGGSGFGTTPGSGGGNVGGIGGSQQVQQGRAPGQTLEDILIRLLTHTVEPNSWSEVGGKGTVQYFPLGLALVVNQTPDIQEQIVELLAALRRLQDLEVAIEMRLVSVAEAFFEYMNVNFDVNITNNSTRYEPQLVSQQFQPAGFINAFRPQGFFSGLTPAGTFTPDLGVPLKGSSSSFALPPFGGFPGTLGADGGLSLGLAFLSDIQVFMFMEAAQGDRRTNVMQAPKITVFNGQNAFIQVQDAQFFLTQINVVPFGSQLVFQPQNSPIFFGVALNVTPVVSADRRFVRLNLQPQVTNLVSAIVPLVPVQIPVNDLFNDNITSTQPKVFQTFFQQPAASTITLNTTVVIPDGGTVLMGGIKTLSEGRNEAGPPILSKIPYINRLFKNVGYGRESQSLMIMVTARIIINEEEEQIFLGNLPPIPRP